MASYLSVLIQAAEPANYKLNYDEHYMISVPFATTTTPGIASFDSDYFVVENGVVKINPEYDGELGNKVDKIVPEDAGIFAYVVRKVMGQVIDYAIEISQDADADTIAMRYTDGRLKVGDGVDNADAVNKGQLTDATTNIPKSALASDVRTSLGKADTAYQKPGTGIPETDLSTDVRTKLNKAISRVGITPEAWQALPVADRDINTMYFVGPYGTAPNQYFVEWMYFVNNGVGTWEAIGSTLAVDLSDYFTKSEINALLAGKANIDGVYSGMSVGHADIADQINTDREIEDADTACPPTVFGTVGGNAEVQSGLMKFPELRGHTIKWNQYAKQLSDSSWTAAAMTKTVSDGVATLTASAQYGKMFATVPLVSGHKYYLTARIKLTSRMSGLFGLGDDSRLQAEGVCYNLSSITNTDWNTIAIVGTFTQVGSYTRCVIMDLRSSGWDAIQVKNIQIFDLTDIYGSGNEPSTVAEFVRDFPIPYYEYNAGTLLSSESNALLSIGRNQWDEEWEVGTIDATTGENATSSSVIRSKNMIPVLTNEKYFFVCPASTGGRYYFYDATGAFLSSSYITENSYFTVPLGAIFMRFTMASQYGTTYNHDICLYDYWETPNLPYVPYQSQRVSLPNIELRSAGTAYDVAYQEGGGKRRIGVVDLGTLDWVFTTNINTYMRARLSTIKKVSSNTLVGNLSSPVAETIAAYNMAVNAAYGIAVEDAEAGYIRVRTATMGTDATAFKAAMSGVMLYYELATETDITIEENPGWTEYAEIDNFGTVKFNQDPAQDIPVPQAYFVRYTVNLVEFLDSLYVHCGGDVSKIALVSP